MADTKQDKPRLEAKSQQADAKKAEPPRVDPKLTAKVRDIRLSSAECEDEENPKK